MLFKKRHNFYLNQNKDALTQFLGKHKCKDYTYPSNFDLTYQMHFKNDRFIVSRGPKIVARTKFRPEAQIKLVPVSDKLTEVQIEIKLSFVASIIAIIMHAGIVFTFFVRPHTKLFNLDIHPDWLARIIIILINLGIFNLIIWITFIIEAKRLNKIIEQIFKDLS